MTFRTNRSSHPRSTRRVALTLAALLPMGAGMVGLAGPASANVTAVKGSAYGYLLNVTLFGGPVNTRGPAPTVTLAADASNSPQAATAATTDATVGPAQFFSSGQADVSTTATTGPTGSVTSTTSIANVDRGGQESFGYGPLDTTTLYPKNPTGLSTSISSTCTASDTGASGSTTITNGQLELDNGYDPLNNGTYAGAAGAHPPVRVIVPDNPAPNTTYNGHIEVNGSQDHWKYVFNEQVTNPDGSLTVYAAHEYLIGPTAVGDLFFGKVSCGVTRGTTTSVASSANPSVSGQPVSFTATVAPTNGPGTPAGTVQFKIDGSNFGGPVALAGGQATSASTSGLGVGSHTVQAIYSGDGINLAGSTGTLTQTVNKAATTTAIASSANPAGLATQVTFTATVSPVAPGSGIRTGTVQFTDNGANLGSPVAVNAAGQATTTMFGVQLGLGAHAITAIYSGSTSFTGSTSPVLNQTVGVV